MGGTGVRETCSHTEGIRQPTLSGREDHWRPPPLEKSPSSFSTWEAPSTGTQKEDFPEYRLLPGISPVVNAAIQGEKTRASSQIINLSFKFTHTHIGDERIIRYLRKGSQMKGETNRKKHAQIQTPEETKGTEF